MENISDKIYLSKVKYKKISTKKKNDIYFLIIIIIIQLILNLYFILNRKKGPCKEKNYSLNTISLNNNIVNDNDNKKEQNYFNKEKFEEIDVNIFLPIQKKIEGLIEETLDEQKFLNGIIRKFKPKKILELGVSAGGSSALILNAIKDLPESKLYSIDRVEKWYLNKAKNVGWVVNEKFPELLDKWKLFAGKNPSEFIETIGNNIDLALIDTKHLCPGEMLNWLEVLPFLKEEALVVFHDAFLMFSKSYYEHGKKKIFSNNLLLSYIRGELILPLYGNETFSRNIGAIKLEKNQHNFYIHYFMALGNQWEYSPDERDLRILKKYFKKYYGEKYVEIFDDAINQNKNKHW